MEDFVEAGMGMREKISPFEFFKAEYLEAEQSINKRESVYWKEILAGLRFTMNYPNQQTLLKKELLLGQEIHLCPSH